jgi:hypothetical protein
MAGVAAAGFREAWLRMAEPVLGSLVRPGAGTGPDADLLTARSLAVTAIASLVALPLLMLASVGLRAPVAAPAIIALGYFAMAQDAASGRRGRERAWSVAVFGGLVGWTLLFVLAGGDPRSVGGFSALLLAPALAAGPAVVRYVLAAKQSPGSKAASEQVRCLDQLAPAEAVVFADRSGRLLAGTRAGLEALGATTAGTDVGSAFGIADRKQLLDAIQSCAAGGGPAEILARKVAPEGRLCVRVAPGPHGTATLKLGPATRLPETGPQPGAAPARPKNPYASALPLTPAGDVQEALAFAVRRLGPKARARGVSLICEGDCEAAAACDVSVCRRILHLLLDAAISASPCGSLVRFSVRSLKGVVLMRAVASASSREEAGTAAPGAALGPLFQLVDAAGGTLVAERRGAEMVASVRLAAASRPRTEIAPETRAA